MAFSGDAACVLISLSFLLLCVQSQRSCTVSRSRTGSQSYLAYEQQSMHYSHSCGWWGWNRCRQTRYSRRSVVRYRSVTSYYSTCCSGYGCSGGCSACCSPECRHGGSCNSPNSCSCTPGWTSSYCQTDVNECQQGSHRCSPQATCSNTQGSYECSCNTGYSGSGRICNDVNECQQGSHRCSPQATCSNTQGSYECSCNTGYSGSGRICNDINECQGDMHGCSIFATCRNTQGSYSCTCDSGYRGNGFTCTDVDECLDGSHRCSGQANCINTQGSYDCICITGYEGSGETCTDIDECRTGGHRCSISATCHNNMGSYTCTCDPGYQGNGYMCTDVDECQLGTDDCSSNAICENTVGSFACSCNNGYSGDGLSCIDVNECEGGTHACSVDAKCQNSAGSYECTCNHGYEGDGYNCFDINECGGENSCNQICHNTNGSYYCSCRDGYYLESNNYTCRDVNECTENNGGCHHSCVNSDGSYQCLCNDGYQLNIDAHTCEVPPLPPTNIVVSGVGKRTATVTWHHPFVDFPNNLTAIAEYEIIVSQHQLINLPDVIVNIDSNYSAYTFNGTLEEFVEYTCSVRARNAFGLGMPSDGVIFDTLPDVPSAAPLNTAGMGESSTLLSFNWTAPNPMDVNGVLQYYIVTMKENETGRGWTFHGIDSFIMVGGLHPYYHYECQVAAYTIGIGPFSLPVTILTDEDVPTGAPSVPLLLIKTPHSFSLEWQPPSHNKQNGRIRHYNLQLTEVDTGKLLFFSSNVSSIEVETLHPFYTYFCKVQAVTIAPGPFSFAVSIQLPESAPSEPPSNVTGMAANATAIYLNWASPSIENRNGIIRHYSINVTNLETGIDTTYMTVLNMIEIKFLHPYYTYEIVISAATSAGTGPPSPSIIVTTLEDFPNGAPQEISALSLSSNSVIIQWIPPEPQYQNGVIVEYLVNITSLENGSTDELLSNFTEERVENLRPHKLYSFAIAAINGIGIGPFSAPFVVRTLEDAPSQPPVNVTVTVLSPRSLVLMWSPPDLMYRHGIIREYKLLLEVVNHAVGSLEYSTASTSMTVTELHPDYMYSYQVAAYTVATGVYSDAATIHMPEDVPSSAPAMVVINNVTSTSAVLGWSPPPLEDQNGNLTHFLINVTSVVTGEFAKFELEAHSIALENLHPFYIYACVVSAATEVGSGPFSNVVEFQTEEAAPSGTPLDFNGTVIDSRTVLLSWRLPFEQELNGVVRSYLVNVVNSKSMDAFQLSVVSSSISVQNLHPFYIYHFQVAAYTIDVGPFTDVITLQTLEDVPSGSPNNVSWEASSRSIFLTWCPPLDEHQNGVITGYSVGYAELGSYEHFDIFSSFANATIPSLKPFTPYGITVVTHTVVGPGPATQLLSITTLEEAPIGQPTNITVVTVGETSIHLEWDHPPEDTHYGVIREYRINVTELETGIVSRLSTDGEDTQITIESLHPFYTYHITIVPFTIEEGRNHTEITVRTEESAPSMAPENVTFLDVLSTQILFCWTPLPDHSKNGIIRHYVLNLTEAATGNFQLRSTLMTNITVSGLKPYTKYVYSVAAHTVSTGPFSSEAYVWTEQDAPSAPPENLTVTPLDPKTLSISWLPPSAANLNGIVEFYTINIVDSGAQNSTVYTTPATKITVNNLHPFHRYSIRIAAATIVGHGPQTQVYTIEMPEDAPSAPPYILHAVNVTSTSAALYWLPPPSIHHNGIIRDYAINITEINSGKIFMLTSQYTNFTLDFLHPFYRYEFSVSAMTILIGPFSEPLVITTMEAAPSSAPRNLSAVNKTSTNIQLQWFPPPSSYQNGIITSYIILAYLKDTSSQEHTSNTTDFSLSSLLPYTTHQLKVASVNSAGIGPFTDSIFETTLEDAPSSPPLNLTHFEVTSCSVYITWSEPEQTNHNGIIRYYVIEVLEQETGNLFHTSTAVLGATITSLHPYYTYVFQTAAVTVARGPYSSAHTVRTLEDVPSTYPNITSLEAVGPTSISLEWPPLTLQVANGIIQNFVIWVYEQNPLTGMSLRSFGIVTNTTLLSIDDLHPYYRYLIKIAAETLIGIGPFSDDHNITTPEDVPTSAPHNFSGEVLDSMRLYIAWSPPKYDEHNGIIRYYEVQLFEVLSERNFTLRESGTIDNLIISALHPYYQYTIKIAAVTVDVGPFTGIINLTTFEDAPSGPPLDFFVHVLNSSSCQLLWNSPNESTQNGIIRSYVVEVHENNAILQQFSVKNISSTELVIGELHPAYLYGFRVAAVTTSVGVYTSVLSVLTFEDVPSEAPQFIEVLFRNESGVLLKWNPPAEEEQNGVITQYIVNVTQHKTESQTNQLSSDEPRIYLTLNPFSEYSVSVSASTQIGPGPFSETLVIATAEQSPSAPPLNIALEFVSSTFVVLTWSPMPDNQQNGIIRYYTVDVLELHTNRSTTMNTSSNSLSLNIDNLHPFYTYNLSVSGVTVSAGPYSIPLTVTTHQDVPSGPPTNVKVVSVGSRNFTVNWEPPLPDQQNGVIQTYLLWMLTVDTNDPVDVIVPASDEMSETYTVFDLHPYYTYNFTLTAITIGSGLKSEIITVQLSEEAPSGPPINVTVEVDSSRQIAISWRSPQIEVLNGLLRFYFISVVENISNTTLNYHTQANVTSIVVDSLHPHFAYSCKVAASTTYQGPHSSAITVTTFEEAPSGTARNVTAEVVSSRVIFLTWMPPQTSLQNGVIRSYIVQMLFKETMQNWSTPDTNITIDHLLPYSLYRFAVTAVTIAVGPQSNFLAVTTPEDAPSGAPENFVGVVLSSTSIKLAWGPVNPAEQNGIVQTYIITVSELNSGANFEIVKNQSTSIAIINYLHPSSTYICNVSAFTVALGPSATVELTTLNEVPTEVPQNITATIVNSTSLILLWTSPPRQHHNGMIDFYAITMEVLDTEEYRDITSNNTSLMLESLHPFYSYQFMIAAVNSVGLGPFSSPTRIQMPESSPTGAVRNFTAVVESSTEVELRWVPQDPVMWNGIVVNYTIQCDRIGPISNTNDASLENNVTTTIKRLPTSGNFIQNSVDPRVASHPPLLELILLRNLFEYHVYNFTVYMYNDAGRSERSKQIVVQLPGAAPSGPPTSIVVHAVSSTSLEITWDLPSLLEQNGVILGYLVNVADTRHNFDHQYNITGHNETHLTVEGLDPFEEYLTMVRAWSEYGLGPQSNILTAQTLEDVPGPPMNVSVLQVNETTVTFSWSRPANPNGIILSYDVVYSGRLNKKEITEQKLVDGPYEITVNSTVNEIQVLYLKKNLIYDFRVRAVTTVGYGEYSLSQAVPTNNKPLKQQTSENSNSALLAFTVIGWAVIVVIISAGTAVGFYYWKRSGSKRNRKANEGLQFTNKAFKEEEPN